MKVEEIKQKYESLLSELSDPEIISDWEKFDRLNKQKESLEKIIEKEKELQLIKEKIEENKSIVSAGEDTELLSLAETEISQLLEKEKNTEKELEDLIKKISEAPQENKDNNSSEQNFASAIVEIRAGTGGEEAALFAAELYKMYSKYAQLKNWLYKVLDSHATELGGFKEIIFEVSGKDAFSQMKYEAGVHRIQRIPETEKTGRVHTSTATIAVLPKPKKTKLTINPAEFRIDFYRASGPGGQFVNKRETAVRITHLPTGIIVASQTERNQLQNKENAMAIMEAKLLEKKETEETGLLGDKRKTQIGGAKRAEKIRTYNFPQDRVTDHRLKKTWHNIEGIMAGKLEPIITALQKEPASN